MVYLVWGDTARNKMFHSEPYPPPEFFGQKGELKNGKRFEDDKWLFMWPSPSRKKVCKVDFGPKLEGGGMPKFSVFEGTPPLPADF